MRQDHSKRLITPPEKRFWSKVQKTESCWLWTASKMPFGYGAFWDGNRVGRAHRFSYELLVGKIPDGKELDHLCRNTACVNPAHLDPVSHRVNMQRGVTGKATGAKNLAKTHCKQGHEYSSGNTYIIPSTGQRHCRECRRQWKKNRGKR